MRRGTGVSVRVVTPAALIMFSIFVAFMTTKNVAVKQIGFSFAVGVLVDAFVVRLTLVPTVMAIVGRRIWFHSRWFERHVPNPDIEGQRLEERLTLGVAEDRTAPAARLTAPAGRAARPREATAINDVASDLAENTSTQVATDVHR